MTKNNKKEKFNKMKERIKKFHKVIKSCGAQISLSLKFHSTYHKNTKNTKE